MIASSDRRSGDAPARAPSRLPAYTAACVQTLIGAATFLVAKDATDRFTPLQLSWLRIVLSAGLVIGAYAAFAPRKQRPEPGDRLVFLALGLLGVVVNQSFFLFGVHRTTPLHASLLYAFTPVLVLAGGLLARRERMTWTKGAGVALAVFGVVLVLAARGLDLSRGPLRGDLIILVAVTAWASYTVIGKPVLRRYTPFTVIAWVFGAGALAVLPAAPWVLDGFDPRGPGTRGWLELAYLCVATSGLAFVLWYVALARLEATQLAVFTNLQAPITAFLAWLVLEEVPGGRTVAGAVLVLAGVLLVQIAPRPRRRR
jgi:drug/metabolite transporter (DMT)-like permease